MRKFILTLIINLFLLTTSIAQIPNEAFPLTNSLPKLWRSGQIEKAVENSIELQKIYSPFFVDNVHNSLSQFLKNDTTGNGMNYLKLLSSKNNEEINEIISGIYLWGKTLNSTKQDDCNKIIDELGKLLKEKASYNSKNSRYCLLILENLKQKEVVGKIVIQNLLIKNINKLKEYDFIETASVGKENRIRAWHRYILSASYYMCFTLNKEKKEFLEKAAHYSPDQLDLTNKSYFFYDAVLLTGNTNAVDYKLQYYKHLVENEFTDKALDVISSIAFEKPLDKNINLLKTCYSKLQTNQPFEQYWLDYINSNCKQVPQLSSKFSNIKLHGKDGQWKFIDVWGTWCKPCVGGLPVIQIFYNNNNRTNGSKVKVLTLSYNSPGLDEFMKRKEYTFPVFEVNDEVIKAFNITHYPTKLLITPQGKYLEIPSKVDWKKYIKNYILM